MTFQGSHYAFLKGDIGAKQQFPVGEPREWKENTKTHATEDSRERDTGVPVAAPWDVRTCISHSPSWDPASHLP